MYAVSLSQTFRSWFVRSIPCPLFFYDHLQAWFPAEILLKLFKEKSKFYQKIRNLCQENVPFPSGLLTSGGLIWYSF